MGLGVEWAMRREEFFLGFCELRALWVLPLRAPISVSELGSPSAVCDVDRAVASCSVVSLTAGFIATCQGICGHTSSNTNFLGVTEK